MSTANGRRDGSGGGKLMRNNAVRLAVAAMIVLVPGALSCERDAPTPVTSAPPDPVATETGATRPATRHGQASPATATPAADSTAPLADRLDSLSPSGVAGLGRVDQRVEERKTDGGVAWEVRSGYAEPSSGYAGVGIWDYGPTSGAAAERPWVPLKEGKPIWPYVRGAPATLSDEVVAGREARLLSADIMDSRRLIVRANPRFDVVFTRTPSSSGGGAGPVDVNELRAAAAAFDWSALDALQTAVPDYAGPYVGPPQRR